MSVNYQGVLQGLPLPYAETDSFTIQVRDSAGNTGSKEFSLTSTSVPPAFTQTYAANGSFPIVIDPQSPAHYINLNAWNGGSGQIMTGWSSRLWSTTVPGGYASGNINGYPYAMRGWYPAVPNPCATANGGTSTAPGVNSCIQISALTKAKMRWIINIPIDRTQAEYDLLCDMYCYATALPAGGATAGFASPGETLFSLSVFAGFLDTTTYWTSFIGTPNPTAATLSASDYNGVTAGGGNVAGRIELDHRMWFFCLNNENWAETPAGGQYNCLRLFPCPWNEIHQVGSKYLYADMAKLLTDLLSSSIAHQIPITSASYFSGPTVGFETDGLSPDYNISAITKATNMQVTISSTASTNPFNVGDRVGFQSAGGMTQVNNTVGTVLATGGASAAWTVTTNINSSAFSVYTSGGQIHKAVLDVLDFQTSMQTEADPVIYTVPEISQVVSRYLPLAASPDAGGSFAATTASKANYTVGYLSSANPSVSTPITFAFDGSSLAAAQKKYGVMHWTNDIMSFTNFAYGTSDYKANPPFNVPGNYTIQGNPAGFMGGVPPSTGWVTIATIVNNTRRERADWIGDWSAYNSLQISVTSLAAGSNGPGVGFHIDVHNCPNTTGSSDGWMFLGDSIINKCMKPGDSEEGGAGDYFGNMMYNYTGHIPYSVNAGSSGWTLSLNSAGYAATMPWIDGTQSIANDGQWLNTFPGRYIWYGLGYNDPAASVTQQAYQTTLAQFLNLALSLGKTVVVPSIWYTFSDSGAQSSQWSAYNAALVSLACAVAGSTATLSLGSTVNPLAVGQTVIGSNGSQAQVTSLGGSSGAWTADLNSAALAGSTSLTRPTVIAGPDLNTIGNNFKAIMFNSSDAIHPSPYGQVMYRAFVTDWIARVIYLGQPASTWRPDFLTGTGTYGLGGIGGAG